MQVNYILDLFGTFAFALSGALMAIKKNMDLFGMIVLALVTAIGGGTVRDMMLGLTPVFILTQPVYIYVSIIATISVFLFYKLFFRINCVILIADAIGLGTFVCIGISKAIDTHVSLTGAVLLGLITAVMGGIIRDLLANEIPTVLIRDFYATACILGGVVYVLLFKMGVPHNIIILVTAGFIIGLRMLAIKFNWNFIKVPYRFGVKGI